MSVISNHPRKTIAAGVLAMAVAIAVPLIKQEEGVRQVGYFDPVHIATDCVGHTGADAIVGKHYTMAECNTQLAHDLSRTATGIAGCIHVDVPAPSLSAFISFSFNAGVGGFCGSSIARDLNAGRLATACADLSAWVYAGKPPRKIPGLVNRRAQERALCLKGLLPSH